MNISYACDKKDYGGTEISQNQKTHSCVKTHFLSFRLWNDWLSFALLNWSQPKIKYHIFKNICVMLSIVQVHVYALLRQQRFFFYVYTSYKLKHNKKIKHLNLYFYMYEASSLFTRTRINIPGIFNKLYM